MAEELTLKGVIERMRAEGNLVRNSGANSMKSLKEVLNIISDTMIEQTSILKELLEINKTAFEMQEQRDRLAQATKSVIPSGGSNSPLGSGPSGSPGTPGPNLLDNLQSMGIMAATIGVALGTALGAIQGWLGTIKTFFPKTTATISSVFTDFIDGITDTISNVTRDIRVKAAFIKVSIIDVLDDFLKFVTDTFSRINTSVLGNAVSSVGDYIKGLADPFIDVGKKLVELTDGPAAAIQNSFENISSYLSRFADIISSVGKTLGKVFVPLGIILTAFDTIKGAIDGYVEDGIIGGLEGAVNGFFTSLITKPLDLIKDAVDWILRKFVFDENSEEIADAISDFSFTELFTNLTGAVFGAIESAVDWVKTIFTDPKEALNQLWNAYVGEGGLLDIMWAPMNLAIDWVSKKFSWKDEDAPEFSVKDILTGWAESFIDWLQGFLPSFKGIKQAVMDMVPPRLRFLFPDNEPGEDAETPAGGSNARRAQRGNNESAETTATPARGSNARRARRGNENNLQNDEALDYHRRLQMVLDQDSTPDFTRASIMNTLAEMIQEYPELLERFRNISNFQPLVNTITNVESAALQNTGQPIIINNTPITNAPVTNNVGGTNVNNSSVTRITGPSGGGLAGFAN